jgi:L-lactate dehydrogenase complex protein LldG
MATTAKENILKKIKEALVKTVPLPFPNRDVSENIFPAKEEDLDILFAKEFTAISGKFCFCINKLELKKQLQNLITEKKWTKIFYKENTFVNQLVEMGIGEYNDLASSEVSITDCENLVARTGTMVLSSANESGRTTSVYAPIHICIAYASQVVYDVKDALELLQKKYGDNFPSFVTFATGPSRTADIEKTLVTGVHGPKEVYCFLVGN